MIKRSLISFFSIILFFIAAPNSFAAGTFDVIPDPSNSSQLLMTNFSPDPISLGDTECSTTGTYPSSLRDSNNNLISSFALCSSYYKNNNTVWYSIPYISIGNLAFGNYHFVFYGNNSHQMWTSNDFAIPTNYFLPHTALSDMYITQGQLLNSNGTITHASQSSNFSATVDYGDGNGTEPLNLTGDSFSLNHIYSTPGTYNLVINVSDNWLQSGSNTAKVNVYSPALTVLNVNPDSNPINKNSPVGFTAYFDDPNSQAVHTAIWDWGDGSSSSATINESNGFGSATATHTYTTSGIYTVTVTISDNNGNTAIGSTSITINSPSSVEITPDSDSYIKSGSQNENEGSSSFLRLQDSGNNRALIKFNQSQLQSLIGSAQNFTATLVFTITDNGNNWGTNGRSIEVHRLTKDWTEGNGFISGNTPSIRGTGTGVTWNCAIDSDIHNQQSDCTGSNVWNMSNSSLWPFASSVTSSKTITNNQTGELSFDVTSDVLSFLNNSNQNFGWIIKKTDEGAPGRIQFSSKEGSYSPKLVINFN